MLAARPRYRATVSMADLMRALLGGGASSLVILLAVPFGFGAIAWMLARGGNRRASQSVANLGIAVGLGAVLLAICSLVWLSHQGGSTVTDVPVTWLLAPVWMLGAAIVIEHRIHPGRQEAVRARVRGGAIMVIGFAVIYWLLSAMRVFMLVHTGVLGLLGFVAALIGLGWVMLRRVV